MPHLRPYIKQRNIIDLFCRTHTIVLVTKTGHLDVVELTLQSPKDFSNLKWDRTEFQFELPNIEGEVYKCAI